MNEQTSLVEVVEYLPPEISLKLLSITHGQRVAVLQIVREALTTIEKQGGSLDPISLNAVAYAIGIMAITMVEQAVTIEQIEEVLRKVKRR